MTLRGALFVLLSAWICAGPAYRQVLSGQSRYVNRWVMFSGVGLGLIEVTYECERPGRERERIDHYRLLGYGSYREAPSTIRRITDLRQATRVGRAVCERLPSGSRVYLQARRAVPDGWRAIHEQGDLCARLRPGDP